jgi:hypothetical protein
MEFHRRTLELYDRPDLALEPGRGAAVRRAAAAAGFRLPESVADWYGVPEASGLWEWYRASDSPAVTYLAGERQGWWDQTYVGGGSLVRDEGRGGWWVVPAPREDLRGWIRGPILPVVYESQGCCWWGVCLDGTADPPVAVCRGDQGDLWDHHARSFSDFVLARAFDRSLCHPREAGRTVYLEGDITGEQLGSLRAEFRVGPTTRDEEGRLTQRYSGDGQRFSLMVLGPGQRSSVWHLWATGPEEFQALVGKLGRVWPRLDGVTPDNRFPIHLRGEATARPADDDKDEFSF